MRPASRRPPFVASGAKFTEQISFCGAVGCRSCGLALEKTLIFHTRDADWWAPCVPRPAAPPFVASGAKLIKQISFCGALGRRSCGLALKRTKTFHTRDADWWAPCGPHPAAPSSVASGAACHDCGMRFVSLDSVTRCGGSSLGGCSQELHAYGHGIGPKDGESDPSRLYGAKMIADKGRRHAIHDEAVKSMIQDRT